MNLKVRLEPIDDGKHLAVVQGSNSEGERHGNLGKVCKSEADAVEFIHKQIDICVDKLAEKSGALDFDLEVADDEQPEEDKKAKTKKK